MSKVKEKYIVKGCGVFKVGAAKGYSIQIGTADAELTDEMVNGALKIALRKIGVQLINQLGCDAVNFTGISFQQMWK